MAERRDMRKFVVRILRPLHGISVENPALPGTPDINYVEGWIECKWLPEWPRRETSIVRIDHFTPQQKLFLHKRAQKGGSCWLLLQCRRDWLLFEGAVARNIVGQSTRAELFAGAYRVWTEGLNVKEFLQCVSVTSRVENDS